MRNPTHYAMGFLLSPDAERVALIRKNRPERLVGLLTGIGGHRDGDETFVDCLVREMAEEAGVLTSPDEWAHFATVDNETMYMPCFVLRSAKIDSALTLEDEPIGVYAIKDIDPLHAAPLALDLIVLALNHNGGITLLS